MTTETGDKINSNINLSCQTPSCSFCDGERRPPDFPRLIILDSWTWTWLQERAENLISDAFSRDIRHCCAANEWVCGGDAMNSALWSSEAPALTWINAQCAARRLDKRWHGSVLISIQKEQIWHLLGGISEVKHDWDRTWWDGCGFSN